MCIRDRSNYVLRTTGAFVGTRPVIYILEFLTGRISLTIKEDDDVIQRIVIILRRWLRVAIEHYLASRVCEFVRIAANTKQITASAFFCISQLFSVSPRHRLAVHCLSLNAQQDITRHPFANVSDMSDCGIDKLSRAVTATARCLQQVESVAYTIITVIFA